MIQVKFESILDKVGKDIEQYERKQRIAGANYIKKQIREEALSRKVTGNLAKGTYAKHDKEASFVGIRAPGYHNFLVEFGHITRKGGGMKFVPGHPVVYKVFEEEADRAISIMSEPIPL